MDKLKILSVAVCCLVTSLWSETQGMEGERERDEPAGIINSFTGEVLNQDAIYHDRICLRNNEEKNLIVSASLIKGSAILIKEVVRYTLEHPIQVALIGLSCQLGEVSAFSEDYKYGTGVAAAVLQGVSMICEGVGTYYPGISNTTAYQWNAAKYGISWVALIFAGITGGIVYYYDKSKDKDSEYNKVRSR